MLVCNYPIVVKYFFFGPWANASVTVKAVCCNHRKPRSLFYACRCNHAFLAFRFAFRIVRYSKQIELCACLQATNSSCHSFLQKPVGLALHSKLNFSRDSIFNIFVSFFNVPIMLWKKRRTKDRKKMLLGQAVVFCCESKSTYCQCNLSVNGYECYMYQNSGLHYLYG